MTRLQQVVQHPPRAVGLKTGTWTGQAGRAFVKRTFGKTISTATARRYVPRQGFRRQRPRKRVTKAEPAAQRAFAQGLQRLEPQREPGSVTVDMDQGQSWQEALPRLGWLLRGQPANACCRALDGPGESDAIGQYLLAGACRLGTLLHRLRRVDDQTSSRRAQTLCP